MYFRLLKLEDMRNEMGQIAQEDTEKSAKPDIPSVPKDPWCNGPHARGDEKWVQEIKGEVGSLWKNKAAG